MVNFKLTKKYKWLFLSLFPLWILFLTGCATLRGKETLEEGRYFKEWDIHNYSLFLQQNMEMVNEIYSTDYELYDFVVDTAQGSAPIQSLIDSKLVMPIIAELRVKDSQEKKQIWLIYEYLLKEYDYEMDAYHWPRIGETLENKKGDCKGLSLLMMSLLLAAGFDSYVAISNGHMWVNGYDGNQWYLFEVDKDPEREKIYQIPGFYENPLFKAFKEQTYKRKRK